MTGKEYMRLAMRTNDGKNNDRIYQAVVSIMDDSGGVYESCPDIGGILFACLGLSGEVGEVNDIIKKDLFHEKPWDDMHLKKEIGDVLWYIAMLCYSLGYDMDEIMQMNIDKFNQRYPNGFDPIRTINRDKDDI